MRVREAKVEVCPGAPPARPPRVFFTRSARVRACARVQRASRLPAHALLRLISPARLTPRLLI